MEQAKTKSNLTIITLRELLTILETGGDYLGPINSWKKQKSQPLIIPPKEIADYNNLLDILN